MPLMAQDRLNNVARWGGWGGQGQGRVGRGWGTRGPLFLQARSRPRMGLYVLILPKPSPTSSAKKSRYFFQLIQRFLVLLFLWRVKGR